MNAEQQIQQKQKYLRQNIDPDFYEDFAQFFMAQAGTDNLDIGKYSVDELKRIVDKFNSSKAQEQQQHKHQRSFAIYQTADLQQAYTVLNTMQKNPNQFQNNQQSIQPQMTSMETNQVQIQSNRNLSPTINSNNQPQAISPTARKAKSPQKPNYQSASDLLDSVLASSQKSSNSPTNNFPEINNNLESKYRSNSQISIFQKGNIFATTANIQNQRKSTQFDNFWQFSSTVNANQNNQSKKTEYKTENPFTIQPFDFSANNNKPPVFQQSFKPTQQKKPVEPVPSFQQLTKNINMAKKPNAYTSGQVQAPSNMKKQPASKVPVLIPQIHQGALDIQKQSSNGKRSGNQGTSKEIKLISQKPISQSSLASSTSLQVASVIKPPTSTMASAYKGNKIPYKGQTIHKADFKDLIKCYQASVRTQLNDNRLQVTIEKHEIVQKNFFVGDYVMYYMSVKPLNIVCKRNYQDFTKLKTALQKFYPGMQLPYLQKNSWFETNAENVKKQKVMLQFFINDLIKNPQIRNSRIFQDFLTLKDHKAIKRKFEQYAKMDEFKSLQQLCITGGKVEVIISEPQRIYHEHLDKMLEQFDDLLGKKNKLIQLLGSQFVQVNDTLIQLSKLSTQLSQTVKKFNQSVSDDEIPTLQSTFNIISKSFEQWASRISFQSKVVNKRLVPFYKYQKDNLQTMRTLVNTQNSFFKTYMKRSTNESSSEIYTSSNLKSYKTGILQQSKNFTVLKYQLGFLGNMVCKESVRFFQLMSDNFKAKWIYQAQKYNQRLNKDVQFYTSISAMAR